MYLFEDSKRNCLVHFESRRSSLDKLGNLPGSTRAETGSGMADCAQLCYFARSARVTLDTRVSLKIADKTPSFRNVQYMRSQISSQWCTEFKLCPPPSDSPLYSIICVLSNG